MSLSTNFTLAELTTTSQAADNTPPPEIVDRLRMLAEALEQIRTAWGDLPIRVSSGYRSPVVNALVGGSRTSSHMSGWAADIFPWRTIDQLDAAAVLYRMQERGEIRFDQVLIYPGAQLHVSIDPRRRGFFGLKKGTRFSAWRPV